MPDPEPPNLGESDVAKTVTLTEKDMKDAARLFKLLVDPTMLGNGFSGPYPAQDKQAAGSTEDRETLTSRARSLLNSRRVRKQYFQSDIFGEPAWEILLALYVTQESGARLTMTKLAEWIEAPLTTVARWVKALEEQSLVQRVEHPTDRRTIFIRLHEAGRSALDAYLASIAKFTLSQS